MTITGKQKAAMLLMNLDPATAAELLKGLDAQVIKELAVELAYLDAAGYRNSKQSLEFTRQFCDQLAARESFHLKSFLKEMLKNTVGQEKAEQIQNQIEDLLIKRAPFIALRDINCQTIASVLENEHPQAAAVVLSELPAKKSSEVLGLLGEGIRVSIINRMVSSGTIPSEAKARIAETIFKRLKTATASNGQKDFEGSQQPLRKVAIILRSLSKELRDGLLAAIQEKNKQTSETVNNLMVVWEDIPQIADRSLQQALRKVDARKLALALVNTDEEIVKKIKSNISERAVAMIDEEASLMSAPKKNDIEQAREEIVQILREMNNKGDLVFVEG